MFNKYDVIRLVIMAVGILAVFNTIGKAPLAHANDKAIIEFVRGN